jgi:hypothetical protein
MIGLIDMIFSLHAHHENHFRIAVQTIGVLGKNCKIPQWPVPTCLPRLGVVGGGNA